MSFLGSDLVEKDLQDGLAVEVEIASLGLVEDGYVLDLTLAVKALEAHRKRKNRQARNARRQRLHDGAAGTEAAEATRAALGSDYECEPRGSIEVKGLGQINTYFLLSKNDPFLDEVPVI